METLLIIRESELELLRRRSKAWLVGFAVAIFMVPILCFALGYGIAYHKATAELKFVAQEQLKASQSLAEAWEEQHAAVKLVTGWAEFIKNRDDLINENKVGQPMTAKRK